MLASNDLQFLNPKIQMISSQLKRKTQKFNIKLKRAQENKLYKIRVDVPIVSAAIFIIRLLPQNAFTLQCPSDVLLHSPATGALTLARHVRRE